MITMRFYKVVVYEHDWQFLESREISFLESVEDSLNFRKVTGKLLHISAPL